MWKPFLADLPCGDTIEEHDWQRRHRLLLTLLAGHVPLLAVVGGVFGRPVLALAAAMVAPIAGVVLGHLLRSRRRAAAVAVTLGLVSCSVALVALTGDMIEAHFHFFVIIGFVALYQDWVPFLCITLFTAVSHVAGSAWQRDLTFDHAAGQADPWLWSLVHGVAVLVACVGIVLFLRTTEDAQGKVITAKQHADAEVDRQKFTHDLLVTLARRNQSMLYRQLEIINRLEESEHDPDTLAELFTLDHLTTRVRRNAESLLVLSGEKPPRTWSRPVPLRDVLRAAIAETEDLQRVVFAADEQLSVAGQAVTDLTHLVAELTENAVRSSPPDSTVSIRARPDRQHPGGQILTVEDSGIGMPALQLTSTNALLARPPAVNISVSSRMGFHVVGRLAARHGIAVSLSPTPGSGLTATIAMPPALFADPAQDETAPVPLPMNFFPELNPQEPVDADSATAAAQPTAEAEPAAEAERAAVVGGAAVPALAASAVGASTVGASTVGAPAARATGVRGALRQEKMLDPRAAVTTAHAGDGAGPARAHPADHPVDAGVEATVLLQAVPRPERSVVPHRTPVRSVPEPFGGTPSVHADFDASDMFREHPMPPGAEEQWLGWWAAEVERASHEAEAPGPPPAPTAPDQPDDGEPDVESTTTAMAAVRPGDTPAPAQPSRPTPDLSPAVPSPRPRGSADPQLPPQSDRRGGAAPWVPPAAVPVEPGGGLRRRVPQSHLAPELREAPADPEPAGPILTEHASGAADALTRYQANRLAASHVVEDGQRWGT